MFSLADGDAFGLAGGVPGVVKLTAPWVAVT